MIAQEAAVAYARRISELRASNAGPLELFLDPVLDRLDAEARAVEREAAE